MPAAIKTGIAPFRLAQELRNLSSTHFLNEDLAPVQVSSVPEEFRRLSRFLPVIVLVPKYAVYDKTAQKKAGPNKSVARHSDARNVPSPLDAAKAWFRNPSTETPSSLGE